MREVRARDDDGVLPPEDTAHRLPDFARDVDLLEPDADRDELQIRVEVEEEGELHLDRVLAAMGDRVLLDHALEHPLREWQVDPRAPQIDRAPRASRCGSPP